MFHVVVDALAREEGLHEVDLGAQELGLALGDHLHGVGLIQGAFSGRLVGGKHTRRAKKQCWEKKKGER